MAGVNDWRFRLAEEEDRRRRKFGWDDLLGLLQTAAGIGTSIAGLKQSGERQALAQEQFDYGKAQDVLDAERQARLDAIAKEKHETGMHEAGYFRADPAMQEPMPSTAQTTSTGMTRLPGYLEDMAGRGAMEDRQALFDEYSSNLPTGAELLPTGGGGYRGVYPPDYGQAAGAGGPSQPDIDRFMRRAEDVADRHMMQQAQLGGEGYLDPMANNAPNRGHPEWQQVYDQTLEGYMGGGEDIEDGDETDLMANLRELSLGVIAGSEEDIAGLAALHQLEPGVAAVVDAMIAEIQAASAGTAGGQVGGFLGMLGQGMGLAERAAALPGRVAGLPGRVAAAPGAIGERAENVSEAAWPLRTLWELLGR